MKAILALFLFLAVSLCLAQSITIGQPVVVRTLVCKTVESAIDIAKADEKGGIPAAVELLKTKDDCGVGTFRAIIAKVIFSAETQRGATVRVVEVKVEMADDSWQTFFILSDVPLKLAGVST